MSTFTKTPNGKIIYVDGSGKSHGLDGALNILPHPSSSNLIIITDESSATGQPGNTLVFDWNDVTTPAGATDRNDLIDTLASDFFFKLAIGWDDLKFPFSRDKQGQSSKPDFDFTDLGLLFPQNDATEIVYLIAQFPHEYRLETGIRPHIHFVQDSASQPVFKMDYRWYKNGEDPTGAFTTLTASSFAFTYTSGSIIQIASFPEISGAGMDSVSSIMDIKVYRDDNVVTGDVLTKEFDIHYQIDSFGSRQEFIK